MNSLVEICLERGKSFSQDIPGEYNGFIYVLEGNDHFGTSKTTGQAGQMLLLDNGKEGEMSEVNVTANEGLKLIFYAGQPLREPVVARGPFVMNTEDEIRQAYKDYTEGKFS